MYRVALLCVVAMVASCAGGITPDGGGVNPPDGGGVKPPDGGGGTPSTYKVSGTVSGDVKVGVALKLVGNGNSYEAKTDASGTYSVPNAKAGTYTLTPSLTGYKFFPATRSVTVSGAAITAQDFATVALGWKKRTPTAEDGDWRTAMSGDAKFLAAAERGGHVYTSSDYGITWQDRSSGEIDGNLNWESIAMSDNGQYLTGVTYDGIFTSSDFGATWHNRTSGNLVGIKGWNSVAMSSDGKIQAAVVNGGRVYMSRDFGESWQEKTSGVIAGDQKWVSIAMSGSGQFLAAVVNPGHVYLSRNSGDAWEEISPPNTATIGWYSIAISDDGNNLAASAIDVNNYGPVYTSKNSGRNWDNKAAAINLKVGRPWYSVAMSPNGQFLSTGYAGGDVFTSDTFGDTWQNKTTGALPTRNWKSLGISDDGKFIVGGTQNDIVYTFVAP